MRKGLLETVITGGRTRTSHAQVVNELGRSIISGKRAVGSLLPNDAELAAQFHVSRTVLREAMKTLAAKGLVVPRAKIGTRVTPTHQWNLFDVDILNWHFDVGVSEPFLIHLSEIRFAFEPTAAGLAARHASPDDIAKITRLAAAMDNPAHSAESIAHVDLEFHLAVLDASRNPFLRTMGNLIEAALAGIFRLSSPADTEHERIHETAVAHIRIIEAIARRDEDGAKRAMEEVIRTGSHHMMIALRRQKQPPGSPDRTAVSPALDGSYRS